MKLSELNAENSRCLAVAVGLARLMGVVVGEKSYADELRGYQADLYAQAESEEQREMRLNEGED